MSWSRKVAGWQELSELSGAWWRRMADMVCRRHGAQFHLRRWHRGSVLPMEVWACWEAQRPGGRQPRWSVAAQAKGPTLHP